MRPETKSFLGTEGRQRLSFESLLSQISALFASLPNCRVDSSIEYAQRWICEYFGFDASTLWQWTAENRQRLMPTHMHGPPGVLTPQAPMNVEQAFPWMYRKIMKGRTFIVSTDDLPETASRDRETRCRFGLESTVVIPLKPDGKQTFGALSFDSLHKKCGVSFESVERLELIAQIFCNALARKKENELYQESEKRLHLVLHAAGAGVWEYDCRTLKFTVSEETRGIFELEADKEVTWARFKEAIQPDDFSAFRKAVEDAVSKDVLLDVKFRMRAGSEQMRWILASGKPFRRVEGGVDRLLGVFRDISHRKHLEEQLEERLAEVDTLKRQLEGEKLSSREEQNKEYGIEGIIGQSDAFRKVLMAGRQVASTDATVLILGETGTGKGVFAHAIHRMSERRDRPFVTVNCAALPANLIESELFGREKGAFTGAHTRQVGRFEVANRGTIFLDEIGEMPLDLQAKLLRVLQDGEFERLGSTRTVKVDTRVIAATARNLEEEVVAGRFRQDLFYRLNVFPITIPPLRRRIEDIVPLTRHFIGKYSSRMGKRVDTIARSTFEKLLKYRWPGNVRELEHVVERCVIVSPGNLFTLTDRLGRSVSLVATEASERIDLASVERNHILRVLRMTGWKIEGPGGAASLLDLHPSTLRFRIKKLGIIRPL